MKKIEDNFYGFFTCNLNELYFGTGFFWFLIMTLGISSLKSPLVVFRSQKLKPYFYNVSGLKTHKFQKAANS